MTVAGNVVRDSVYAGGAMQSCRGKDNIKMGFAMRRLEGGN